MVGGVALFFYCMHLSIDIQPYHNWKKAQNARRRNASTSRFHALVKAEKEALDDFLRRLGIAILIPIAWELLAIGYAMYGLAKLVTKIKDTYEGAQETLKQPDADADKYKAFP
jgi:hypothetical protein